MGDHHGAILVVFFADVAFAATNSHRCLDEGLLDLATIARSNESSVSYAVIFTLLLMDCSPRMLVGDDSSHPI